MSVIDSQTNNKKKYLNWSDFGLDDRITKSILKLNWTRPTAVQSESIPYTLQGKDVLVMAHTGSGKTGAFAIPVIQRVLAEKESGSKGGVRAVVLVPTVELAEQVRVVFVDLCYYSSNLIRCLRITGDESVEAQEPRLAEIPDVVIATPGRLLLHLTRDNIDLSTMLMLVIDEADLVMSYGYKDDLDKIKGYLPSVCQGFLMSATLSKDVTTLKNLVLHTPIILEVEEAQEEIKLKQFVIPCPESERFLLLYALIKLKLVNGKILIFVNDINRCFQLKLFFERFSIPCALLNADLPQTSRNNIVLQFNRGQFDILIATDKREKPKKDKIAKETVTDVKAESEKTEDSDVMDDSEDLGDQVQDHTDHSTPSDKADSAGSDEEDSDDEPALIEKEIEIEPTTEQKEPEKLEPEKTGNKKGKKSRQYSEFGVSRGIDFRNVANVINFDFPHDVSNYVHRVGRTARAGRTGAALSLISDSDLPTLEKVTAQQKSVGAVIEPYSFKMSIIEGFRYRVEDVLRTIGRKAIKEARQTEIKNEILNSQKLKAHFEENPTDLQALKHDKELKSNVIRRHLKIIPFYLMPSAADIEKTLTPIENDPSEEDDTKYRIVHSIKSLKSEIRRQDPLRSFQYGGRGRGGRGRGGRGGRGGTDGRGGNTAVEKSDLAEKIYKRKPKKKKKRIGKMPKSQFKSNKPRRY